MKKVKSALQRITMGVLALLFTVTLAVPKAKAVTGVDDVSVGIMAVLVHLESIGGSLAVQQGTALATQNAVTSLATQAGAAGALGAGVTGSAALATIGAAVTAFAGGYTIGYAGYETLSKLVSWLRQSYLTGSAPNKVYTYNITVDNKGWKYFTDDGLNIQSSENPLVFGDVYTMQSGTTFWVNRSPIDGDYNKGATYDLVTISPDNLIETRSLTTSNGVDTSFNNYHLYPFDNVSGSLDTSDVYLYPKQPGIAILIATSSNGSGLPTGYFRPKSGLNQDREEVVMTPPAEWVLPAPAPGQVVHYRPYPNAPQKTIEEIVEDVPKDIYDKKFDPVPPQVIDPTVPPVNPDLPPVVNPNPPVDPPAEVQPYTVQLGDVFPFCIPFDLYHMVTLFVAEPEAPHAKWEFNLPFAAGTYKVEWDLQEWDEVAALCRKMELILFCVGLAVVTYKLIKW